MENKFYLLTLAIGITFTNNSNGATKIISYDDDDDSINFSLPSYDSIADNTQSTSTGKKISSDFEVSKFSGTSISLPHSSIQDGKTNITSSLLSSASNSISTSCSYSTAHTPSLSSDQGANLSTLLINGEYVNKIQNENKAARPSYGPIKFNKLIYIPINRKHTSAAVSTSGLGKRHRAVYDFINLSISKKNKKE